MNADRLNELREKATDALNVLIASDFEASTADEKIAALRAVLADLAAEDKP